MGKNAEDFLACFNRIDKWMQSQLQNPNNMGFSEMTRRLARQRHLQVHVYENDLLQIAQLRNAIVHDRIATDFVIAEPNEWVINRLKEIETQLLEPERVIPVFKKYVTGFEKTTSLTDILRIVNSKRYSQFPIYDRGKFLGLITAHGLGLWMASQCQANQLVIDLANKTAEDVLKTDRRRHNYQFVSSDTYIYQVAHIFMEKPTVETVFITKDGHPDGNLIGIIRPKDIMLGYYKDWRAFIQ